MASSSREQQDWRDFIAAYYPDYLTRTYCVPPVHFNRVAYQHDVVAGQPVLMAQPMKGAAAYLPDPNQPEEPYQGKSNPTTKGQSKQFKPSLPRRRKALPQGPSEGFNLLHPGPSEPTAVYQRLWVEPPPMSQALPSVHETDLRDDFAQQHVLYNLQRFGAVQDNSMFILSQFEFNEYLNRPCYAATVSLLPTTRGLGLHKAQGEIDVLVFHRLHGVLVGEIKSVGLGRTGALSDANVARRVAKAANHLEKSGEMVQYLLQDVAPGILVRKALMLPYVTRSQLLRVLQNDAYLEKEVCRSLMARDAAEAAEMSVCCEELSAPASPWRVEGSELAELRRWWSWLVANNPCPVMTDQLYLDILARFVGPATTVSVHCMSRPRVEVRTRGQAVAELGRRVACLVLTPRQLDILTRQPAVLPPAALLPAVSHPTASPSAASPPEASLLSDRVALVGPPGTGKTIVLELTGRRWCREGHDVHVLSPHSGSIAASYLLAHQLQQTVATDCVLTASAVRVLFHHYDFDMREEDVERAISDLVAASEGRQVCVLIDEVQFDPRYEAGSRSQRFVAALVAAVPSVRLWTACLFHDNIPTALHPEALTYQLRCAPAVMRQVVPGVLKCPRSQLLLYTQDETPYPADGLTVLHLHHEGFGHTGEFPDGCHQCGLDLAGVFMELGIGSSANSASPHAPACLQYSDVFVLTRSALRQDSGVAMGLRQAGIPICVTGPGTKRNADVHSDILDIAVARRNEVTVTDATSVNGLERCVVVWLAGRKEGKDDGRIFKELQAEDRLYAVSRCTTQLIVVHSRFPEFERSAAGHSKGSSKTPVSTMPTPVVSTPGSSKSHDAIWLDDSMSAHSSKTTLPTTLLPIIEEQLNDLSQLPYPESYEEKADLKGAKVLHRQRVLQLNNSQGTDMKEEAGLCHQLVKQYLQEASYGQHLDVLQQWSQEYQGHSSPVDQGPPAKRLWKTDTRGAVWMSDTLPYDLGLPLETAPPDSVQFQVVFLAPGRPAVLFTVFNDKQDQHDPERYQHDRKEVDDFTLHMDKLLTSAILNFCCCDFIVVPVAITCKDFTPEGLDRAVKEKVEETRSFYSGLCDLELENYRKLKDAVTAVVGTSWIPIFLQHGTCDMGSLILMDQQWRAVVSLLIEKLTKKQDQTLECPEQGCLKMEVAVLEVSRRLSFRENVVIVTEKNNLIQCCGGLKRRMQEDTGVVLQLSAVKPSLDAVTSETNYVIIFDRPYIGLKADAYVLHVCTAGSILAPSIRKELTYLSQSPYPESYKGEANLKGAKVLHRKRVLQLNVKTGLRHKLAKRYLQEDSYRHRLAVLQQWSRAETGAVWMSNTLPYDLGLPLETAPPNSVQFQVVFLAPGRPAVLFTVFNDKQDQHDPERYQHDRKEVDDFTLHMDKLLTSAILNFCCCDFIVVPVAITCKDFTPEGLDRAVKEKVEKTRSFYSGLCDLKLEDYRKLKDAVTAVVGTSWIPIFLQHGTCDMESLVLMDKDWRALVSLLIEKLTNPIHKQQDQTMKAIGCLKSKVAVLEVSRRLSFREKVLILTGEEAVIQCCEDMKRKTEQDTGIEELQLSAVEPSVKALTSGATYFIIFDRPDLNLQADAYILRVTSKAVEGAKDALMFDNCCTVCQIQMIKIIFRPCSHAVCCPDCAKRLNSCPICRAEIVEKLPVYLP